MNVINNPLSLVQNPNALISLLGGAGGGQVVINVAKLFGWDVKTGWATLIAGAASYVLLYIGREGFAGIWNGLAHGFGKTPGAPPPGGGGDVPPPAK